MGFFFFANVLFYRVKNLHSFSTGKTTKKTKQKKTTCSFRTEELRTHAQNMCTSTRHKAENHLSIAERRRRRGFVSLCHHREGAWNRAQLKTPECQPLGSGPAGGSLSVKSHDVYKANAEPQLMQSTSDWWVGARSTSAERFYFFLSPVV